MRKENRIERKTRSRVEHVFALLDINFGFVNIRYRGFAKNLNRFATTSVMVNFDRSQHLPAASAQSLEN